MASMADALAAPNRGRLKAIIERWGVEGVKIDVAAATPRKVVGHDDSDRKVITISTVPEKMLYDIKQFTVKPGQKIKLILKNPDQMLHNLLILKAGSLERVGAMADQMLNDPTAQEKSFVPKSPDVLVASDLVGPDQSIVLRFTAPTEPGDYPYICTFPGHWRLMKGVMTVVKP